ncbi:MAG: threonine/serine exporter family protein [Lachnospiraceae bacterium]|nr:threonine/serine exporter family protein [Lachnospiraceae bacterium]
MEMMEIWMKLLFETVITGLGSLAFGIVYKVKARRLPFVAAGGGAGWFLYSIMHMATGNIFLSNIAASLFATAYSELMARKLKAPVVVLLLPCLIPLVPGGGLYYAMSNVVMKNNRLAFSYLSSACEAALGIAAGIIVVSVLMSGSGAKKKRRGN